MISLPFGQSCHYFVSFIPPPFEHRTSSPENPDRMLVKRILALEGDVVKTLPPYPDQEIVVPQGHVWVEGLMPSSYSLQETFHNLRMIQVMNLSSAMTAIVLDRYLITFSILANCSNQLSFDKVPRALLDSKLVMIIWPPNRFGSISRPEFPPNNYGQANRLAMTQLEREKARHSRVTIQS